MVTLKKYHLQVLGISWIFVQLYHVSFLMTINSCKSNCINSTNLLSCPSRDQKAKCFTGLEVWGLWLHSLAVLGEALCLVFHGPGFSDPELPHAGCSWDKVATCPSTTPSPEHATFPGPSPLDKIAEIAETAPPLSPKDLAHGIGLTWTLQGGIPISRSADEQP